MFRIYVQQYVKTRRLFARRQMTLSFYQTHLAIIRVASYQKPVSTMATGLLPVENDVKSLRKNRVWFLFLIFQGCQYR